MRPLIRRLGRREITAADIAAAGVLVLLALRLVTGQ
jgi:hypothetical protein